MANEIKITKAHYDSRLGNHSYSEWTTGTAYRINLGHAEVGFVVFDRISAVYPDAFADWMDRSPGLNFTPCTISEMSADAQNILVGVCAQQGIEFPWADSCWHSQQGWEEYTNPKTPEGILAYIARKGHFARNPFAEQFSGKKAIFEVTTLHSEYTGWNNSCGHTYVQLYRAGECSFLVEEYYNYMSGYHYRVRRLSKEEAADIEWAVCKNVLRTHGHLNDGKTLQDFLLERGYVNDCGRLV